MVGRESMGEVTAPTLRSGVSQLLVSTPGGFNVQIRWESGGVESALMTASLTLVVGGLLVFGSRTHTERVTDRIRRQPVRSCLLGLGALIGAVALMAVGVISVIGVVIAAPVAIGLFFGLVYGVVICLLTVGHAVRPDWGQAYLLAVVLAAVVGGVPVVGGLLAFAFSIVGMGAGIDLFLEYWNRGGANGLDTPPESGGVR
ncbi:hypothetical protein [Halovivax gelatinilyticus]|uniref:hypothetical protein n=1 Tax=Halovivax gelatinilyticus TaxID=2961597 RepID=UPI0020CA6A81|nr:hypothetical protein [Halovivax gelatinilyticus]